MIFTSREYLVFLLVIVAIYWSLRRRSLQNLLLLLGGYFFYGFVHPWFCLLIAFSTLLTYAVARCAGARPQQSARWLAVGAIGNLGMLGVFKYFDFFAQNMAAALSALGFQIAPATLGVLLPAGISFFTFQSLGYVVDVHRRKIEARRNLLDYALFVGFFPVLLAGPIERAGKLLPQIEQKRVFRFELVASAWPLLLSGCLKKLVIADNLTVYVDKVYMLERPSYFLLAAGAVAFTVQILADFSGYTDIARGSARLLGFELGDNFRQPYLATTPSDFWRRWHISFSTWIRDYLYIPLGGSRVDSRWKFALVLAASMGLSGLWHGAAWNFVCWGLYHAVLVFLYHVTGHGGRWSPVGRFRTWGCRIAMLGFTVLGWMIFRATDMGWLLRAFFGKAIGLSGDPLRAGLLILGMVVVYCLPLWMLSALEQEKLRSRPLRGACYGMLMVFILVWHRDVQEDFIYFQF